ncbi:MAG: DUF167 domain-containing protein [Treponema sp.]|jgi:uncharacterized protein (TIGR00251 family)|nr:DUF167 domain-containing protein [Treponema sp.]
MTGAEGIRLSGGRLLVDCKVLPGASKSTLRGMREGRLWIRIAAAPEDGKANQELRAFLAGLVGCSRREVAIHSGEKSRLKTLSLPASCQESLRRLVIEGEGTA